MRIRFDRRRILAAGAIWLLAGCTVGPDYVRPTVDTPTAYKEAGDWAPAQPRDGEARGEWWAIFGDPGLNALVPQVAISNQNVILAEARFREAQALLREARAGYFPTVSANASAARSGSAPTGGRAGSSTLANTGTVSLDASWELDVWGRVRRSVEAGTSGAQATAADLESVRLSSQAALAQAYFLLRAADSQKQLLDDSVAAYARSLQLVNNQYAAGIVSKAEVAQAQTQLNSTMAQAIDVSAQRAQLEHAIAVLIGKPPSEFSIAPAVLSAVPPPIPVGLPSELLQRRPDIAAAERRVAAANAQIGIAQAAFFPSLTLSASGGLASAALADLATATSRLWSVGAAVAQSVFDGGLRRAQSDQARAVFDETVANYRQTVLGAFQEVEDNLAVLRLLEEEAQSQERAVQAARLSVTLTTNQYKAGTVSYLAVVVVQAAALANERTAVDILGRRMNAAVLLVKALGGGWRATDLPSPEQLAGPDRTPQASGRAP